MSLINERIKGLEWWKDSKDCSPVCSGCKNTIKWGMGYIIETKFYCNECVKDEIYKR